MINNYQNHHYFQDGGNTEPHAEKNASAFAAAAVHVDDDNANVSRRQLPRHHHHRQQQQLIHNEFLTNFNLNVIMNINHEEDGGIDINDNHESFHRGCMIDLEDNDHENGILGCHDNVSNSSSDNAYNNDNEANHATLASIPTNDNNTDITLDEYNGENLEHNDDGENCWQVVPDSLDHLSRDELCRIIYRLDYERNALLLLREQQQQQQQQEQFHSESTTHPKGNHPQHQDLNNNNYHPEHGNEHNIDYRDESDGHTDNKRKKKRRKTKRVRGSANGDGSNAFSSHDTQSLLLTDPQFRNPNMMVANASTALDIMIQGANVDEIQQQLPHPLPRVSGNNEFETNIDVNGVIVFTTAVEEVRSRLRCRLIDTILSSAIHGGRRIPKSTIAIEGVSYQIARAIVVPNADENGSIGGTTNIDHIIYYGNNTENNNNPEEGCNIVQNQSTSNKDGHELSVMADTKRMIKWRISGESYIAKVLGRGDERLIHPVRHDGTGIYVVSLSSASSSSLSSSTSTPSSNQRTTKNMYHYARFQSLDVKYDKWENILSIIAKTVAADEECGR